jgi:hypothetical protein
MPGFVYVIIIFTFFFPGTRGTGFFFFMLFVSSDFLMWAAFDGIFF